MTTLQALGRCPLFSALTEDVLAAKILPLCTLRSAGKGTHLIMLQERLEHIGVLCEGRVQVLNLFPDGNSYIVDVLNEGDVLGLDLLFTHSRIAPYYASASTGVKLLYFPVNALLDLDVLDERTRLLIYRQALEHISQSNMRREYRLAILAQRGLRERILTYLTMQANRRHTASFTIPFSREELAGFLCVNRSSLSHELSLLQQEGVISFRKNHFTLHHWEVPGNQTPHLSDANDS